LTTFDFLTQHKRVSRMARASQDREDLLRDATAFATRVQLKVPSGERSRVVFAGFRMGGAMSIYFDQDPVYHFNTAGHLRRAFVNDDLVKAERGRLVCLRRQRHEERHEERSESESALIRNAMTPLEQQDFCQTVRQQLHDFLQEIVEESYVMDGQVQEDGKENVLQRLTVFLEQLGEIVVAESPHVITPGC